jgi:hypothetical protein
MITRASIPATPGVLGSMQLYAVTKALPKLAPQPLMAQVASLDVETEVARVLGGGSEEGHNHAESMFSVDRVNRYRTMFTNFCGITFVARGDVTVTHGAKSHTGTVESVLLWEHGPGQSLPKFLLNSAPINGRPLPEKPMTLLNVDMAWVKEKMMTFAQCNGRDRDSVPLSDPGSIKFSFDS